MVQRRTRRERERVKTRTGNSPSEKSPTTLLAVGVLLLVGTSIAMYFTTIRPWKLGNETYAWTAVPCTILATEWSGVDREGGGTPYWYYLEPRYEYEVDGVRHVSDKFMHGGRVRLKASELNNLRMELIQGSEKVCYVDPQDPTMAVLRQGTTATWGLFLAILAFFLAGVSLVFQSFQKRRPQTLEQEPQ